MKTSTTNTEELHRELTENTLAYLYESLDTIRHEIQNEHAYNIDETGFLTQHARQRISSLEQEERDILKNIRIVSLQLEFGSTTPHVYSYENPDVTEDEFDLDRTLQQYEKEALEYQEEKALQEIEEARQHGVSNDKSHELTR